MHFTFGFVIGAVVMAAMGTFVLDESWDRIHREWRRIGDAWREVEHELRNVRETL